MLLDKFCPLTDSASRLLARAFEKIAFSARSYHRILSGGARPKILTKVDGEDWIIKFPSSYDSKDIGRQEYDYAMCAKECGIAMENVRLFSSERTKGYFGTKRFDRTNDSRSRRIHIVSTSVYS